MSVVTGNFSLVVNAATPPPNPLTITPASGALAPETEGVADPGTVIANVKGGTAPYTFAATGVPSGMDLKQQSNADGKTVDVVLEGAPAVGDAAGSPYALVITVTDSAPVANVSRLSIPVRR